MSNSGINGLAGGHKTKITFFPPNYRMQSDEACFFCPPTCLSEICIVTGHLLMTMTCIKSDVGSLSRDTMLKGRYQTFKKACSS